MRTQRMVESMPEIVHKNPEVKKIIEKLKTGVSEINEFLV